MTHVIFIGSLLVSGPSGESPEPTVSTAPVATMPPMALRRPICERIFSSMPVAGQEHFACHQSMTVDDRPKAGLAYGRPTRFAAQPPDPPAPPGAPAPDTLPAPQWPAPPP